MAQWHTSGDERWRLAQQGDDEYLIVSFPDKASAETGIAARTARGLTLLEVENVGRVEARFALLRYTPVPV